MAIKTISAVTELVINRGSQACNRGEVDTGTSTMISPKSLSALVYAASLDTAPSPIFKGSFVAWSAFVSLLKSTLFLGIPVFTDDSIPEGELHAFAGDILTGKLVGITG